MGQDFLFIAFLFLREFFFIFFIASEHSKLEEVLHHDLKLCQSVGRRSLKKKKFLKFFFFEKGAS